MDDKLKEAIAKLNTELHCGSVREIKGKLYYRSTKFPPKPGSRAARHDLPLRANATMSGLNLVKVLAREIDQDIVMGRFEWSKHVRSQSEPQTVGAWIDAFTQHHWNNTKLTQASQATWQTNYETYLKRLPSSSPLDVETLTDTLIQWQPESRSRAQGAIAFVALARFANLDEASINTIRQLGKGYKAASITPRDLPSDAEIGSHYGALKNQRWAWVYAMIATYGLRPHEVFFTHCDGDYGQDPIEILKGKTGYRIAYPVQSEIWRFNFEFTLPKVNVSRSHRSLGHAVAKAFHDYGIPFPPYHLRHSYARRCSEVGFDVAFTAESMGHSVAVHSQHYRAWLTKSDRDKVYQRVMKRRETMDHRHPHEPEKEPT